MRDDPTVPRRCRAGEQASGRAADPEAPEPSDLLPSVPLESQRTPGGRGRVQRPRATPRPQAPATPPPDPSPPPPPDQAVPLAATADHTRPTHAPAQQPRSGTTAEGARRVSYPPAAGGETAKLVSARRAKAYR